MKYAIIGISLKFPDCENINEYWNILEQNKSIISKHPKDRFNESYYDPNNIPGKMNCEKAGYLKNIFH